MILLCTLCVCVCVLVRVSFMAQAVQQTKFVEVKLCFQAVFVNVPIHINVKYSFAVRPTIHTYTQPLYAALFFYITHPSLPFTLCWEASQERL